MSSYPFISWSLTIDIDWAPDFMIRWMADVLIKTGTKATWFITHESPAVDFLRQRPKLFELGAHPNFLDCSTQGSTHDEVIEYCRQLVPEATCFRTHSLFSSSPLLRRISETTPWRSDLSVLLPKHPGLQVTEYAYGIRRIPFWWEDDAEMGLTTSWWRFEDIPWNASGLKVFNFHPVYTWCNISHFDDYMRHKAMIYRGCESEISSIFPRPALAGRSLFIELAEKMSEGATLIREVES